MIETDEMIESMPTELRSTFRAIIRCEDKLLLVAMSMISMELIRRDINRSKK